MMFSFAVGCFKCMHVIEHWAGRHSVSHEDGMDTGVERGRNWNLVLFMSLTGALLLFHYFNSSERLSSLSVMLLMSVSECPFASSAGAVDCCVPAVASGSSCRI
jgi:hypothetical protein